MPYAPGIQDISGQLLAQGMLGAAQTRAQAMGDVGQFMRSFGSEILKNEEERQKTTGAIKAFIDDPYYQQKIAQNPELTNAVDRIKAGKAGSAEVKGFLGTLTTMQHTREEQMKADQMQAQIQYNQALREQAIANKAATDAATAERVRQNQISDQMLTRVKELDDFDRMDAAGTPFTIEQAERYQTLKNNPFLPGIKNAMQAGVPDAVSALKLLQSQEAIDVRQQANEALAASRERERDLKRENAELKVRPKLEAGSQRLFYPGGKPQNAEWDGSKFIDLKTNKEISWSGPKPVTAEWDGSRYIDTETGAPIYVDEQVTDKMGNVMTRRGSELNPLIAKRYGIPIEKTPAMGGGMPWDTGGGSAGGAGGAGGAGEPDSFSPGAEVGKPKPAAKTIPFFSTREQAQQALMRGEIQPGQTVMIDGRPAKFR